MTFRGLQEPGGAASCSDAAPGKDGQVPARLPVILDDVCGADDDTVLGKIDQRLQKRIRSSSATAESLVNRRA